MRFHKEHAEARKIASKVVPLNKGMVVHHIDGNPTNNNPNNLMILTRKEHRRAHIEMDGYINVYQKRTQEPLKRNKKKLEMLLNLYNDGIYI